VAEGRRHTFEDSIRQNLRLFEREVDEKRQMLRRLPRGRLDDLVRISAARLEALQDAAADKAAEVRGGEAEQRESLGLVGAAILAKFEQTASEQRAAFEELLGRVEHESRKTRRAGSWRRTAPPVTAVGLAFAAAIGGTMLLRDGGEERSSGAHGSAPEAARALPAYSAVPETTPSTSAAPPSDASADLAPIHWRADQLPSTAQPAGSSRANPSASPVPAPPLMASAPLTQQSEPLPSTSETSGDQGALDRTTERASQRASRSSSPNPAFPPHSR